MIHLKIYLVNIIFITICLIQCVQTAGELENLLKQTIYTVYAPKTKVVENEKCVEQSKIYYDALMNNQNWALKSELFYSIILNLLIIRVNLT